MAADDITPLEKPLPNEWTAEKHAIEYLIKIACTLGSFQMWSLNLTREIQSGRVPNWKAERSERLADIKRRLKDLEILCEMI